MKKYVLLVVILIMSFAASLLLVKHQNHSVLNANASLEALTFTSHAPNFYSSFVDDTTDDIQVIPLGFLLCLILPGIVRVTTSNLRVWHVKSPLLHLLTDIPPPLSVLS